MNIGGDIQVANVAFIDGTSIVVECDYLKSVGVTRLQGFAVIQYTKTSS